MLFLSLHVLVLYSKHCTWKCNAMYSATQN